MKDNSYTVELTLYVTPMVKGALHYLSEQDQLTIPDWIARKVMTEIAERGISVHCTKVSKNDLKKIDPSDSA